MFDFKVNTKILSILFVLALIVFGTIMAISQNDNLVARFVHDQGLRNETVKSLFKTGLMANSITSPVIGDVSMYTSRRPVVNPRDTFVVDSDSDLKEVNPVHYVNTPAYDDLQASLEGKGPSLGPPTAIRI